jgi:hypothetical protein
VRTEGIWLRAFVVPYGTISAVSSDLLDVMDRGLSILDIAVAQLILERAVAADTGTMLRYH